MKTLLEPVLELNAMKSSAEFLTEGRKLCEYLGFAPGKSWDGLDLEHKQRICADLMDADHVALLQSNLRKTGKSGHYMIDVQLRREMLSTYRPGEYPDADIAFFVRYQDGLKAAKEATKPCFGRT